jgi:DNA-binding GntR family transcriptional regulator
MAKPVESTTYKAILNAIDVGIYKPGDRLVESELATRFGGSRTPIREALQRLETQSLLARDGRSLIVASLDHDQMAELYAVRGALEGLAAELAAQHAAPEEISVLYNMIEEDRAILDDPATLSQSNRRFHRQLHRASHNRYLVQQLDLVYRSMALLATTSLAVDGRGVVALDEHLSIVQAIEARDAQAASKALRDHLSVAYKTRLQIDAQTDL